VNNLHIKIPDIKVNPKGEGRGKFLKHGVKLPSRKEKYFEIKVEGKNPIPVFIRDLDEPGPFLDSGKREIIFPNKAVENYVYIPPSNRPLFMIGGSNQESNYRYSKKYEKAISKLITHYNLLTKLGRMHIVAIHEALHDELLFYELDPEERNIIEDMLMPFLIHRIYGGKKGYHIYNNFKITYSPLIFAFVEMFKPKNKPVPLFCFNVFNTKNGPPKFNNSKGIIKPCKIWPLKKLHAPLTVAWGVFEEIYPEEKKRFFEFTSAHKQYFKGSELLPGTSIKLYEILNQTPFSFSMLLDGWLSEKQYVSRNKKLIKLYNHMLEIGPKIEKGEEFDFNLKLVTDLKNPEVFN
jgi:hypothetical protein